MPVNKIYERWHFHQRMNQKVAHNIEKLIDLYSTAKSKQAILDGLHPWRVSTNLRYNNLLSYFLLLCCAGSILFASIFLYDHGGLLITVWLLSIAVGCFAYLSVEHQSDVEGIINNLETLTFQYQYNVRFAHFPNFNTQAGMNPNYMLARVRQGFASLNQGNAGNEIVDFAATSWQVQGHDFPVLLFQYLALTEVEIPTSKGEPITKQIRKNFWGACVFDMPNLAFCVSNERQKYERYPISWTSSDAQFNRDFHLYGQQEFELAKNLTPSRILTLASQLDHMRGTLMFHDQMQAFCYISTQDIFQTRVRSKSIDDISQLRGHLRTLKAPHYERMQKSLQAIIRSFMDERVFIKEDKKIEFY
ncbi:hypothetical protein [Acinetobacter sp.]|uniref:hypothetical protein n=1 Tax=Acinetobacter sp. TaxID=472 RepID=UPI0035B3BAED